MQLVRQAQLGRAAIRPAVAVLLVLFSVIGIRAQIGSDAFNLNSQVYSSSGSLFVGAASGDLNLDGRPDVAVCDRQKSQIVILMNSGRLGGGIIVSLADLFPFFAVGDGGLSSIDIADLDQDRDMDIVVSVDGTADQIIVLYNRGQGISGPASFSISTFPAGGDPAVVKLADLTDPRSNPGGSAGDGAPEIVVINRRSNTVTTLINSGRGDFGRGFSAETGGYNPISQTLGDFNDDNKIDTAVLNRGRNASLPESSVVTILLGRGDGSFQPSNFQLSVPARGVSIAAAGYGIVQNGIQIDVPDLNLDGIPDLAVASERGGGPTDIVSPFGDFEAAALTVFQGGDFQNGQFFQALPPQALVDTGISGGRVGVFPGADDPRLGRRIGYGSLILNGDFNQNGLTDAYVCGLERNNGALFANAGKIADDFAAGLMNQDKFGGGVPGSSFFNILPSSANDAASVTAQAPTNVDVVTSALSAGSHVVTKTGQIVAQSQNDFDSTAGRIAPDLVHVTMKGNVYLSSNTVAVANHAPIVTTENGLADFNGQGRKLLVTEGEEVRIKVKLSDLDNPVPGAFRFSLVTFPSFTTLSNNPDGTVTLTFKPDLTDGSSTANNGLGQEYPVVVQVLDDAFVGSDTTPRRPLTSKVTFRVFVKDKPTGVSLSQIPDQTMFSTQTLTVPVKAFDSTSRPITLSAVVPRFGRFADQGGGSGLLTFEPKDADAGTFTVTVTGRNDLGLSGIESFKLTVVSNAAPTVDPFQDVTLFEGDTRDVSVRASDPNTGQRLQLSLAESPPFVTLSDSGDGRGLLRLAPRTGDGGQFTVAVVATDDGVPSKTSVPSRFRVTVVSKVTLVAVHYLAGRLFISGSGFGASPTVFINEKPLPAGVVLGTTDTSVTAKGGKKKLNLKKGTNTIRVVNASGQSSSPYVLQL